MSEDAAIGWGRRGRSRTTPTAHRYDAIVIGGGLSGLLAAAALVDAGARVYLVAKGGGYLHFTSGCVDVLGAGGNGEPVPDPLAALDALVSSKPIHPYGLTGREALEGGLELFRRVMSDADYPFLGDLQRNLTLPTAIGSTRSTCLAPHSMAAGDLQAASGHVGVVRERPLHARPILIVGFKGFRDFYPPLLAANLETIVSFPVRALYLDPPKLQGRHHLLSLDLARAFGDPSFRQQVAREVKANLGGAGRVGFPAVLGQSNAEAARHLEELIGVPVFEIPTLPPSVAGIRIYHAFRTWLMRHGVRVEIGFWVTGRSESSRATEIEVESAGRRTRYTADAFILATGGIGGGGIKAYPDGRLEETVFGLLVDGPTNRTAWFRPGFLGLEPQPISLVGIRTNERLQPLDTSGRPLENVFVTGSNLPSWDPTREKSGEGVALATGWKAAKEALKVLGSTGNLSPAHNGAMTPQGAKRA